MPALARRVLGRSGVEVPVLGFGCGGSARLMVGDDTAAQDEAVRTALAAGIDYFDTAPAYGAGRSEANLGRALHAAAPPRLTISTKVVIAEEEMDSGRDAVLRSAESSLRRLRRDQVDMLLLHNRVATARPQGERMGVGPVLGLDDVLGRRGVLAGFAELLASGTIRACGITTLGGEPAAVAEVLAGEVMTVINAAFSLAEPTAGLDVPAPDGGADHAQVIDTARSRDIGVIAVRVLGSGRLLDTTPPDGPLTEGLRAIARRLGRGDAHAGSLRFSLAKPGVTTAVVGFSEAAHVRAAAAAVDGPALTAVEFEGAAAQLRDPYKVGR
ncbi:MAG: aldo/keto reductase [Acidimicrobiales bacterium]